MKYFTLKLKEYNTCMVLNNFPIGFSVIYTSFILYHNLTIRLVKYFLVMSMIYYHVTLLTYCMNHVEDLFVNLQ